MENVTEQESFWQGEFGNQYSDRNKNEKLLASNLSLFSSVLKSTGKIDSLIEFGANIGMNLKSLKKLLPDAEISGIEINKKAYKNLEKLIGKKNSYCQSINNFTFEKTYDLCLIKGVLIHINPEQLSGVYHKLYLASKKYILIAEYYNPTPVSMPYRGHENKLFKRDFAGEMLDKFQDLFLLDYGFVYHRDNLFPQDDINWFLLKKK